MNNPHHIEVTLTEDDLVNANCFATFRLEATKKNIRHTKKYLVVFILPFVLLAILAIHFLLPNENLLSPVKIIIIILILLMSVFFFFSSTKEIYQIMRKNIQNFLRETMSDRFNKSLSTELGEDGIISQNFRGQFIYNYSTVSEILENENTVYVFLDKADFFFYPRDRIPAETLDAFLGELKARVASAKETKEDTSHA